LKNRLVPMPNFNLVVPSQNTLILAPQKWKLAISCVEKENILLQHRKPSQDAYVYTIWAHYHKLCPHFSDNMIGHFVKDFFMIFTIFQVQYFSLQLWHIIWHHAKVLHCLDHFLISYAHFKLYCAFLIKNGKIVNSLYS
jgi:hypothetical protein